MFLAALLLLAAPQDATVARPAQAADGSQRWSILVDPCASAQRGQDDIVVCGQDVESPRIPLPDERGPPDRAMPSNPDVSGAGALAATRAPCATLSQGCTTGVDLFGGGTALVRLIGKVIDPESCCERPGEATNPAMLVGDVAKGIGKVFRKKPDKSNRVSIPLDDPAPASAPSKVGPAP